MLAILTMVPFYHCDWYYDRTTISAVNDDDHVGRSDAGSEFVLQYYPQIMASYFLYFVAILVFASYLYVTLRSLFLNNLTLANGAIRFHSSVTAIGMFLRMLALLMGASITCGLAYSWLKMWMVS